jgi:flagellar protein FliO/FliZ
MAGGLALVLALMVGILALVKRFKVTGFTGRVPIRVLGSTSVGSRQNVVVVEVEGRRLVVGVGPNGVVRLADLDTAEAVTGEGKDFNEDAPTSAADSADDSRDDQVIRRENIQASKALDTPFGQAMLQADDAEADNMIARTTRDLKRHLQLLRSGTA